MAKRLSDSDYRKLADFRHAIRRFLEFSGGAAKSEGLAPQQHQALLAIRGNSGAVCGIGRLAERLCIRPNTAAELANRLEASGLVRRTISEVDRRQVELSLTGEGERKLERLSRVHREELARIRPEILELFASLDA